jgi:hypothetical protein
MAEVYTIKPPAARAHDRFVAPGILRHRIERDDAYHMTRGMQGVRRAHQARVGTDIPATHERDALHASISA